MNCAFMNKINKAIQNPKLSIRLIFASINGLLIKTLFYFLYSKNVKIGKRFRAFCGLKIKGPGKVMIGDNFTCRKTLFKVPCIITHSNQAEVSIGHDNYFGGTQISCARKVEIGNNALLANTTLIDSAIIQHPLIEVSNEWIQQYAAPIKIGDHCWLAMNTFVLKGVELGAECVLSAGSVANQSAEPLSLLMGNPARKIRETRVE